MPRMLKYAVAVTAVIGALAPTSALASPPAPGLFLSTTCAHPGENVTVKAIAQGPEGATYWWQLTASYYGFTVASSSQNEVTSGGYQPTVDTQFTVPWYAPWTTYSIRMTIGSGPGTSNYLSASTPLRVSFWC